MSALPFNVDRRPGAGYYAVYDATGWTFRAARSTNGIWRARASHVQAAHDHRTFDANTLRELAVKVGSSVRPA